MSLLDDVMKQVNAAGGLDGMMKDHPQLAEMAQQFFSPESAVGPSGGLHDVLGQLQASGLGDVVASWMSGGQNKGISGEQVKSALNSDTLNQFASQAGIDLGQAASLLAGLLPGMVDQASPQGSLPEGQGLDQMLGSLLGTR